MSVPSSDTVRGSSSSLLYPGGLACFTLSRMLIIHSITLAIKRNTECFFVIKLSLVWNLKEFKGAETHLWGIETTDSHTKIVRWVALSWRKKSQGNQPGPGE